MKKLLALILAAALAASMLTGCGNKDETTDTPNSDNTQAPTQQGDASQAVELPQFEKPDKESQVAIIETSAGTIKVQFFPESAPKAVENFLTHAQNGIWEISRKSWLFLILSGLATGGSWLCYYKALQIGEASKVVPIDKLSVVITLVLAFVFLHEEFTVKSLIGCILIGAGTLVMVI